MKYQFSSNHPIQASFVTAVITIFADTVSMKKIGHLFWTVKFYFVQKTFNKTSKNHPYVA